MTKNIVKISYRFIDERESRTRAVITDEKTNAAAVLYQSLKEDHPLLVQEIENYLPPEQHLSKNDFYEFVADSALIVFKSVDTLGNPESLKFNFRTARLPAHINPKKIGENLIYLRDKKTESQKLEIAPYQAKDQSQPKENKEK